MATPQAAKSVNEWPVIEGSFVMCKTSRGLPQFISTFTLPGIWKGHKMLKKGEFSLSEAEYWWYIFVLNNVVGFGLSEMQGKFGKYFVCNRSKGRIATFLFNINGAFNYGGLHIPFPIKKDNIEVLMTEVLRLKNEIFYWSL